MLSLRHVSRDQPIEGMTGLILTYADTGLHGRARSGAAGVSYRRPVRVTMIGSGPTAPIRDHVMMVRLAVVALLVALNVWGWGHGR
jgi:hypothetical protein